MFERGGELLHFSPLRLGAVETVYAMTIHKSQGSQFDTAAVLLPAASSRILTRELLYTAVTRARRELILVGTEDAVRQAVERAGGAGLGAAGAALGWSYDPDAAPPPLTDRGGGSATHPGLTWAWFPRTSSKAPMRRPCERAERDTRSPSGRGRAGAPAHNDRRAAGRSRGIRDE